MNIRTRIITAFLSLLIVPLLVVILGLILINTNIIPIAGYESLSELSDDVDAINEYLNDNIDLIYDSDVLHSIVDPMAKRSLRRVIAYNNDQIVFYDSKKEIEGEVFERLEIETLEFEDADLYKSENYIVNDNVVLGSVVFYPNISGIAILKMLFYLPLILIGIFVATIIAMMIILSKVLTDGILRPLNELNYAADRISSGDLDYEMKYTKDNEIGKFCNEFEKMRLRLKYVLDKQNRYEKSRKELIASISHDLKTPLTSIKGYIEGLQDGIVQDKETYDRYLNVIHHKTLRLNHLIDDLFMFSKLELNEFQIDLHNINSIEMLERIIREEEIDFSGLDIELIVNRPFPSNTLRVDEKRILQIIDNLLSNSAKFARSFVKVSVVLNNNYYEIFVEDDGIGIAKDDIPYIFDHFYKADKSRADNPTGTGLGLAICKQLAEAHGGNISVSSELGLGSIFKLSIPIIPN
ncbi:MAG: HAMP domain-containing sensor histidine kinase [Acidaminobacteraceae bacterium]